jgi:hypothetical protein
MAQKIKDMVFGKKAKIDFEGLEKVGVRNLNSQDVANRLYAYEILEDTIQNLTILKKPVSDDKGKVSFVTVESAEEKIELMINGIIELNSMLVKMAAPWGAAGSEQWFATVMSAWKTLYTRILNIATTIQSIIKNDYENESNPEACKMELVNEFYLTLFQLDYLAYAQLVYSLSWRRDDVANKWALTLYQPPLMNPYSNAETITSSGGRTSEDHRTIRPPRGGPYPAEMDNSVRG